jgi:NitT/TauT family transport system substrate-binding protein
VRRYSKLITGVAAVAAISLAAAACGDDDGGGGAAPTTTAAGATTTAAGGGGELTKVSLQLQWFAQAQFAGYYAAVDKGFYEEEGLDVDIKEGGVDIVPQTQLATGAVDFAISWVPKALASREQGAEITNIAQVFQRSGTLQVAWADSGISTPADLKGKKVGNWGFGNEFELFAGMTKAGLDPATDVTLVGQQFDMNALLNREIDAAQAMTYNEYAQVLEAKNPETGELYQPEDLVVLDWNEVGTAMLQDAIWADSNKLANDEEYRSVAERFVKASLKGWAYCRDNPEECAEIVTNNGSKLGKTHQLWMMNEINKLIWPSSMGVGMMDETLWDQTVEISLSTKNQEGLTVLTEEPSDDAYTNDLVTKALEELEADGVDTKGTDFEPQDVELTEGGV